MTEREVNIMRRAILATTVFLALGGTSLAWGAPGQAATDKDPKIGVVYPDVQFGLEALRATELRMQKYGKPVANYCRKIVTEQLGADENIMVSELGRDRVDIIDEALQAPS